MSHAPSETLDQPPVIEPTELMDDPHASFRALRRRHTLVRLAGRAYLVLGADDVISLLTDPRTKQIDGCEYNDLNQVPDGPAARFFDEFFLFSNGADHRVKRALFARTFSLARMRAQRPEIRAVADGIVAKLPRGRDFDFVESMAARIPIEMIAHILGLPSADGPYFAERVYMLSRGLNPAYPSELQRQIDEAAQDLFAYVDAQVAVRVLDPGDDVLSAIVQSWMEDRTVSRASLVHQIMGMIVGGVDTTRAAFAMTVALLLDHPDQWRALLRDPTLVPGAIGEALRFEPSVGSISRVVTEPLHIGGHRLEPGEFISVSTMSAMRDAALYRDPDSFDITRTDHPRLHVVFGHGPHRCIGEMLARFEMEEALAALIVGAPDISLRKRPRMIGFGGIRQITPMEVRIG